jgi:hypothetical protein
VASGVKVTLCRGKMRNSVVITLDVMKVTLFKSCSLKAADVEGLLICL